MRSRTTTRTRRKVRKKAFAKKHSENIEHNEEVQCDEEVPGARVFRWNLEAPVFIPKHAEGTFASMLGQGGFTDPGMWYGEDVVSDHDADKAAAVNTIGLELGQGAVAWDDRGVWRPSAMMPCLLWARECSQCLQPSVPVSVHPTVGWMLPGVQEPMHGQEAAFCSAVNEQHQEVESEVSEGRSTSTEGLIEGMLAEYGAEWDWDRGGLIVD